MKKILLTVSGGLSLLVFLILLGVTNHMAESQSAQQMAARWSPKKDAAQISCFFSQDAEVTEDMLMSFGHSLDNALKEASITLESTNPSARLWVDAYSASGRITLTNGNNSLEAAAIGIGGDFFLFHPLKLVSGSFFSGNDLMQDYCVIDEDAAWQLFGSNNVAGMTVYIGEIPHIVTGVVEREAGRLEEAAGLEKTIVYVSYDTLSSLGTNHGINHYEIIMPNPVTGFAYNQVEENIGIEETEIDIVENTSRYSLLSRIKNLGAFGTRSMNGKSIIYPYWENLARGYEDMIGIITLFMLLFLLYPIILCLIGFIIWWRHKGWSLKDVRRLSRDKLEHLIEKKRRKKYEEDSYEERI